MIERKDGLIFCRSILTELKKGTRIQKLNYRVQVPFQQGNVTLSTFKVNLHLKKTLKKKKSIHIGTYSYSM